MNNCKRHGDHRGAECPSCADEALPVVYIQLPAALGSLWQSRYWKHEQDKVARVYERLNRLHCVIDSHPYLSGMLTKEHTHLLRIVAGGSNQVDRSGSWEQIIHYWQPAPPHYEVDFDDIDDYVFAADDEHPATPSRTEE